METFEPAKNHNSPLVNLQTKMGAFAIHHYNSRLRLFDKEVDAEFNHAEFIADDGRLLAFKLTDDLMDSLMEKQWPYMVLPFVDTCTMDWFISISEDDLLGVETLDDLEL